MQVMETKRHALVFHDNLTSQCSAVNFIISKICSLAGGLEKPQAVMETAKLLASTDPKQVRVFIILLAPDTF